MAGKPVVRGTRIPVELVLKRLSQDLSLQTLFESYPRLTEDDCQSLPRLRTRSTLTGHRGQGPIPDLFEDASAPCHPSATGSLGVGRDGCFRMTGLFRPSNRTGRGHHADAEAPREAFQTSRNNMRMVATAGSVPQA